MPSTTTASAPKRKRPSFDPPRPKGVAKSTTTPKPTKASKPRSRPSTTSSKKASRPRPTTSSGSPSASPSVHSPASHTASPEPEYMLAEITTEDEPKVTIPTKLLTTLLHHNFQDKEKTKIGKDASLVVGHYVDTFVREALARAVYERQEADRETEGGRGDGFLEVEDLEKLAPQLILDF